MINLSKEHLKQFIERIERLESEKSDIAQDIRELYSEAKGTGFCTKTIREIVKLRKKDSDTIEEEECLLYTYKRALGMVVED